MPTARRWPKPRRPTTRYWPRPKRPITRRWTWPRRPTTRRGHRPRRPTTRYWPRPRKPTKRRWPRPRRSTTRRWPRPARPTTRRGPRPRRPTTRRGPRPRRPTTRRWAQTQKAYRDPVPTVSPYQTSLSHLVLTDRIDSDPSATDPGTPDRSRRHDASARRMGAGEPGDRARPGMDRPWCLPRLASVKLSEIVEAAGLLEGVRVGHRAREVDAACFDVAGAGRGARRRGRARRSWAGVLSVVFVLLWPRLPLAPLPRWKDASSWPESTRPRSN